MEYDLKNFAENFGSHESTTSNQIAKKWLEINESFFFHGKIQDIPDHLQVVWSNSDKWSPFGSNLKKKYQKCWTFAGQMSPLFPKTPCKTWIIA